MVDVDPRDVKRPRYDNYYPPPQHHPHPSSTPGPPPPPPPPPPSAYTYRHSAPPYSSRPPPPPPPHAPVPREPSRDAPTTSEPSVNASGPDVRLHGAAVNPSPGRNYPVETRLPPNPPPGPSDMTRPLSGQGPPHELPPPPSLGPGFPPQGPPIPPPGEPPMPPMDQPAPHVPFHPAPPYPPEHLSNGVGTNGFHVAHHQEGFHPPAPHFQQPAGPVMYQSYAAPTASEVMTKKRQTRATMACTNCRAKKQRCDEKRPCTYCKQNELNCTYADVAAPKADRQMNELQAHIRDGFEMIQQTLAHFHQRFERIDQRLDLPPMNPEIRPPRKMDTDLDSDAMEEVDEQKPIADRQSAHHADSGFAHPNGTRASKPAVDPDYDPLAPAPQPKKAKIEVTNQHTTGVHHLAREWKAIRDLFRACGIDSKNYAGESEIQQGPIRLYGVGQGRETEASFPHSPSSGHGMEEASPAPHGPDRDRDYLWGGSFQTKPHLEFRSGGSVQGEHIGGLNPDGSLNLDATVIRRLARSYLTTMHTLHPFIPADELNGIIESFISHYSPQHSPRFVHSVPGGTFEGAGMKRKHSSSGYSPRPVVDRTVKNAVALLVMAMGKMLEYTDWLPPLPPVPDDPVQSHSPWNHSTAESPSNFVRPSPPSSGSGHPSPMEQVHTPGSRRPSSGGVYDRWESNRAQHPEAGRRNVDVVPGLAYYAHATGILGDHLCAMGSPTLRDVQAYLLGGLYMGQLCRPLESHRMIHMACRLCLSIVRVDVDCLRIPAEEGYQPPKPTTPWQPRDIENIKFVFWTCLQLEGDIRAEFDEFEASGIAELGNYIGFPLKVTPPAQMRDGLQTQDDSSSEESQMIGYYTMQNYLRVQLNRVHSNLYTIDRKSMIYDSVKLQKAIYEAVVEWRGSLEKHSPFMAWSDAHHQSPSLNDARLRGKFYGSGYVISRPYLHQAIHSFSEEQISQLDPATLASPCEMLPDLPPFGSKLTVEQALVPKPEEVVMAAKCCLWFAQKSTNCFDGLKGRWLITNIHGTATAQFGNVLVLYAAYQSFLRDCIPQNQLVNLFDRTIALLDRLSPLSNTMKINARIVRKARAIVLGYEPAPNFNGSTPDETYLRHQDPRSVSAPQSANVSFASGS